MFFYQRRSVCHGVLAQKDDSVLTANQRLHFTFTVTKQTNQNGFTLEILNLSITLVK